MADAPSISQRRHELDKERREFMKQAMAEFDKGWNAKRAALQTECSHVHWIFSHIGPLGNPWYFCGACGKSKVEGLED